MAILRPIDSRLTGAWTVTGAATAHAALSDANDATIVSCGAAGARALLRLGDGGIPEDGVITYRLRAEHTGGAQEGVNVTVNFWDGDPDGDGRMVANVAQGIAVPRNRQTISRNFTKPQQNKIPSVSNLWVEILVDSVTGAGVELQAAFVELEVPDDPVGSWNSDMVACPVNTLVWLRMTDGRARQGRRLANGEWDNGAGAAIELDTSNFIEDAEGLKEASRSAIGWGAI